MRRRAALAAFLLALTAGAPMALAEGCTTPQGALRRSVLDAVRVPVAENLRQSVEFVVRKIRVCGRGAEQWAFVFAKPQRPGGAPIDWRAAGHFDCSETSMGLLYRAGPADPWTVVDYAVCPTDVTWAGWSEQYGAPPQLFD
ncbi:MAG: hypothetical protein R3D68_14475 [Hyphomicrobiaceae bacterium]